MSRRATTIVATSNHIFNPDIPTLGKRLEAPTAGSLGHVPCFKYAEYDYVMRACDNDYVRYVLQRIPIFGRHSRVLIDIKIHELKQGEVACVPGWHLDGSINPNGLPKEPETFTLFVTGERARTKFLGRPISLPVDDSWSFVEMNRRCAKQIPDNHPEWTMPSCTFGTYDDHYFHRGVSAGGDERRLLVRTTETDIIKPQNRIYTPYTHSA